MDESVSVLSEDIDAGLVRAALRQITSSACFVPAGRLRRFLQFAVERTLEGQCEELKEYPIGLRVFDRKESFDPRLDPIVRVEAGRLRARLKQYYETDGRQDELLIEFHKGGYVPTFSLRRTVNEPVPEAECARKAVVVLPFQDQSPARDQDYFCHGVTEEIIIALTKVEGLRVTARASTFHLQERHSDWHEVAVSLGVSHVVQGSVRKDGNRLRITAHLIDAKLDCYLWSETFDREVRDVFAIQEEISQAIVNTLRLQLNAPLVRSSTQSSRAYKLYLKGRYYWNKRSEEGLREAVRYFDSALQEDGQFALASAGLADSYSLLGNYGVLPPHSVRPKALNAALQAVQTAPELAETRTAFGHVLATYEWDWARAEQEYETAIGINARYATAHHWYAITCLMPQRRLDEALEEMDQAREFDPVSVSISRDSAVVALCRREYQRAAALARKTLDLDPYFYEAYWILGLALEQMSQFSEAAKMLEHGASISRTPRLIGALGHCHALRGRRLDAETACGELAALSDTRYVSPFNTALIHLGLNNESEALRWLEKALVVRSYELVWLKVDPRWDSVRSLPRFAAILEAVGLGAPARGLVTSGNGNRFG